MQLTNTPGKLVLPFANAGAKNTIPTASQIGITAGAASLTDGFPPLTRTPIAAGGVPPSGLDMNGILYELSAILRWANAGGGYAYDAAFATDSNVGGYPKGARIMRSDGLGYWFNTVENNTTDPEAAGAAAAGWVPDFTNGVTSVAMASANVTLTPLQYGKPIIVITGTLTANLNLIFPTIVNEWTVINNTTGPYTITCKTAAGTGLVVNTAALIVGDGTNIQSAITDAAALFGETVATATGGTADAITATFAPVPRYPSNGVPLSVRATAANATTTPTFTPNSGVIAAATVVKGNNLPLAIGDIAGAGHWLELAWDSTLSKWVLLNPATGVTAVAAASIQGAFKNLAMSATGSSAVLTITADAVALKNASGQYYTVTGVNLTPSTGGASGSANSLDTGAWAYSTWYNAFLIWNGTTLAALFSLSATAPTLPSGYTHFARIGAFRTPSATNYYPLAFTQSGRRVQYKVAAGSNVAAMIQMASGAATNAAVAVGSFIPPTAGRIMGCLYANVTTVGNGAFLGPSASQYLNSIISPTGGSLSQQTIQFDYVLESTNIYYSAAAVANGVVYCTGWEDNL